MKEKDIQKYAAICINIKDKIRNIQANLPYGITSDDKAFLELVNDLLK